MYLDNVTNEGFSHGEISASVNNERIGLDPSEKWAVATVLLGATAALQKSGWGRAATLVASAGSAGMAFLTAGSMACDGGCEEKHNLVVLNDNN